MSIEPKIAPVKPRVTRGQSEDAVPLEDAVLPLVEGRKHGIIEIAGPPGSGKTAALQHLAAVFAQEPNITFVDGPDVPLAEQTTSDHFLKQVQDQARDGLVFLAQPHPLPEQILRKFALARWGRDEAIEYLLAEHRDQCSSVMRRIGAADDLNLLDGLPALWRIVLDGMAHRDDLSNAAQALELYLRHHFPEGDLRKKAEDVALFGLSLGVSADSTVSVESLLADAWEGLSKQHVDRDALRTLRLRGPQILLAVGWLLAELEAGECHRLRGPLPYELVKRLGRAASKSGLAFGSVAKAFLSRDRPVHPMAASILHAANVGWRPRSGQWARLDGAFLRGADWSEISLAGARLRRTDFGRANLSGASLNDALAADADFGNAKLDSCSLDRTDLRDANLARADLTRARGDKTDLRRANLANARLRETVLRSAKFADARLEEADLTRSDLTGSSFTRVEWGNADFSGSILDGASFSELKLHEAMFRGARFAQAKLTHCSLECMEFPGVNFGGAELTDCELTAAAMPEADFKRAKFAGSGLADVNWERADLRGADLRGATFHMGSSRSGLVESPIASEGTRTGFYTDESGEQYYKSPEEIRKANLRGADIRGANIDGVDFYLVDLRDARYDPQQEKRFRGSGAILED